MSSYYEIVNGNLSSAEIAKSEDINAIQTNIQTAFQQMLKDTYGEACILDENEEALKLTPTPYHIDQENTAFNNDTDNIEDYCISFYDRYLRQKIKIEKSEIQSIRVQMHNKTQMQPTIFAEIRDSNMLLIKETNVKLPSTIEEEDPIDIDFVFDLKHLPTGDYYFVIRPVDISSTDLSINGDESIYDIISPNHFLIKFDQTGNYEQGLDASYNGVDYLNANLLEDQIDVDGDIINVSDNNYDLCFQETYSKGNTYLIEPAACMVNGEKTYPMDTHVTIDGPAKNANRIDLITLNHDGRLEVIQGEPFTGKKSERNYPIHTSGLKVAYITTYYNSADSWTCPNCGTVNEGNLQSCSVCDTTTNNRIPLIEQDDDNNITRQRDVLERLRRLEKKVNYQIENNSPSRVKYTCPVDPTLAVSGKEVDGVLVPDFEEGTYKVKTDVDENGNTILRFDTNDQETFIWSIVKQITTTSTTKKNIIIELTVNNIPNMPVKKPKKPDKSHYLNIHVNEKVYRTVTVKKKSGATTTKQSTQAYWTARKNVPVTIEIKTQKGKLKKTIKNKKTNSAGNIQINLWDLKLSKGKYWVYTKCDKEKIKTNLIITDKDNKNTGNQNEKKIIPVKESNLGPTTVNVEDTPNTFIGNDSFTRENIHFDDEKGEVYIEKTPIESLKKETWTNIPSDQRKNLTYGDQAYTIQAKKNSQQNTYAMLSLYIPNDCTVYKITPYIKSFKNIEYFKIILFKNGKVFNIDTTRNSYVKQLNKDKAANTNFPNEYESSWVKVQGTSKKGVVTPKTQHTFSKNDGIPLSKGTYSIVILGKLDNTKKNGSITLRQYRTAHATTHGALSKVKGNLEKIFIEKNSLQTRASLITLERAVHTHGTTGTLTSKTVPTRNGIRKCTVQTNFETPAGTDILLQVSNNGGKNYISMKNDNEDNSVTFVSLGTQFKWRAVFDGIPGVSPKIKFNPETKYAIKFELSEEKIYTPYEDYGRCFSTPILNANTITRQLIRNENVMNRFEEWEFCRLWMEDPNYDSTVDICFSYDDNNFTTTVETPESQWATNGIFFSQIFSNLTLEDFSQDSVDYSNYNADVEYDENNFRFKYDVDMPNLPSTIITTPILGANPAGVYNYFYGDITNDDVEMSSFDYGLMSTDIIYQDNANNPEKKYAGVHMLTGPYYQALYKPIVTEIEDEVIDLEPDNETPNNETPNNEAPNTETSNTETSEKDICWVQNGGDPNYTDNCIIGVSFEHGLKIEEKYTNLTFDLFVNLRDCMEDTESNIGMIQYCTSENIDKVNENIQDENLKYKIGDVILNNESPNTSKYIDEKGFYYIPSNTFELVVSLNPYGLIDDNNLTYGRAYSVNIPLRSCQHTPFTIDLSDLYGSTIYSFGIRVNKNVGWVEETDPDNPENKIEKNPSLHSGDIIGLGNISFSAYNVYPYVPYVYTGETDRIQWQPISETQQSTVELNENKDAVIFKIDENDIPTTTAISNTLDLFEIPTDINLVPYDWVDISYNLNGDTQSIFKGEVIFDLYDTTDYTSTVPIESLPLPAWGRIQNESVTTQHKVTHAWFKLHTDAHQVKTIVLRRGNPSGRTLPNIELTIHDITFLNTTGVPALGPQMQVRIYPQDERALVNTKIRKFGCIYRLG